MTGLSRCWRCKALIHLVNGRWVHKGGVAYSDEPGGHMAGVDDPSAGEPPQPARDDPSPRDIPRHRGEGSPT